MTVNDATETLTSAGVVADAVRRAADRAVTPLDPGGRVLGIIMRDDEHLEKFEVEEYLPHPTSKGGDVQLSDAGSLAAYVNRHSTERGTTLWADAGAGRVVAVIDDHQSNADTPADAPTEAGWGMHRAELLLLQTPEWRHWLAADGNWLEQQAFAEHLEDGADCIRDPDPATILEVAQSFHAHTGARFSSTRMLGGEVQISYEESTQAGAAGKTGTLEVPQTFTLALQPFEGGGELYSLTARFRYRLSNGVLLLGYRLIRPDRVRKAAFQEVTEQVSTGTGFQVLAGTPRD